MKSINNQSYSHFGANFRTTQMSCLVINLMPMQQLPSSKLYFCLWVLFLNMLLHSAQSDFDEGPKVPCYFAFGDSLFDNGNNNNLPTMAKANYVPYGIDYDNHTATGRFSNDMNIVDVIAKHLGFNKSVPPFASTVTLKTEEILKGVNYASGAAGILEKTGKHLGARVSIAQQLINHGTVVARIGTILGLNTSSYLESCLYLVTAGSNDFLNNYFLPKNYTTSRKYSPVLFATVLSAKYLQQLKSLYHMGARKVAVFGLGPLGCTPQAIRLNGTLGILCSADVSEATTLFNIQLRLVVDHLNSQRHKANFTYINMNEIYLTSLIGFIQVTVPCCDIRWDGQCKEGKKPCRLRDNYIFYDNFHPTEAMNIRAGDRAYSALTPLDADPVDIETLISGDYDDKVKEARLAS